MPNAILDRRLDHRTKVKRLAVLVTPLIVVLAAVFEGQVFAATPDFRWAVNLAPFPFQIAWTNGIPVARDNQGNTFVIASFSGTLGSGTNSLTSRGSSDVLIAKYDRIGQFEWIKQVGGTGTERGSAIAADNWGNCYVAGFAIGSSNVDFGSMIISSTNANYLFVAKFETNGQVSWVKKAESRFYVYSAAAGIAVDSDGNSYITGSLPGGSVVDFGGVSLTNGGAFVVKLDASGQAKWAKRFDNYSGGVSKGVRVVVDKRQNTYVGGTYTGTLLFGGVVIATNGLNTFLTRLDSAGNLLWGRGVGLTTSSWPEQPMGMALDATGNCYLAGMFDRANVNFGGIILTNHGQGPDVFVAKYNAGGGIEWAKCIGGNRSDYCGSVTADEEGNCYVVGSFSGTNADFDGVTLASGGSSDIFVVKFDRQGRLRWVKQAGGTSLDSGVSVALDSTGNSYIVGVTSGTAFFDSLSLTARGAPDSFLAKINAEPPTLGVSHVGSQALLYWPANKTDFQLEGTIDLSDPSSWAPVIGPSTILGDQRLVIDDVSNGNRFYRLRD